jgi:uncharacterized phage-associated protein
MHDPRAIANTVLDAADRYGIAVSNLKLQKLLYFAHGRYLVLHNQPLVRGSFEAWQHGPVQPLVYQQFKEFGAENILARAMALNPVTREKLQIASVFETDVVRVVDKVVLEFGDITPGRLVAITHARNGPWDVTIKNAAQHANLGLQISDEVIRTYFGRQIILMRSPSEGDGEIDENTPYT